jgi:iron complex outermembrane receptor protein
MKNSNIFVGLSILCFLFLQNQPICAQQLTVDSLVTIQSIQDVIVRAKRPEKYSPGSRITSLDSTMLHWYRTGSLSDILQMATPIYLKSYGPGMLSSIAFRGTAASHTAVLWNGFNIIQPSNGQTDFAIIPVYSSDAIDIQHGNASTNYGSGAMGGTILLSSPLKFSKGFATNLQQSIGSFGHYSTSVQASFSNSKISIQTKLFHQQAQNNFTFQNDTKFSKPTERQVNASFQQYGFTQDIGAWLSSKNLLTIRTWYAYNNRHIPPAMGAVHRNATQLDNNLRLSGEWNSFNKLGNTTIRVAYFNEILKYSEEQLQSKTAIQTLQSQAEHEYNFKDKVIVKAGAELQQFYAQVDGYGRAKNETRTSVFLLTKIQAHPRFNFNFNLRQSFINGFNPPFTPSAGYQYFLLNSQRHRFSMKGNVAQSYRVPTLNERFWQQGGNPDIKPENSKSYEQGLLYQWHHKKVQILSELTAYLMKVDNWIQWLPSTQGYWSPINVMQVNPRGLELSTKLIIDAPTVNASIGAMYAYTESTVSKSYQSSGQPIGKQLMYVPLHTGTFYGLVNFKGFTLGSTLTYTGFRYTNNSNSDWLPAYLLVNPYLSKSFYWHKTTLQLSGRVNNLINTSYQNMENRPMPGRNVEIRLSLFFYKQPNNSNKLSD